MRLLLDENISPRVAEALRGLGHDVSHVREVGLKGASDRLVLDFARRRGQFLVTLDADFADTRTYSQGSHSGIIRIRRRFAPSAVLIPLLEKLLPRLAGANIPPGTLVVTDGVRYRVRRRAGV